MLFSAVLASAETPSPLVIPRVEQAPALDDFLGMKPGEASTKHLAKVEGFIQRFPSDGNPSTQRTEVYIGYDNQNLYVVFLAFDSEPNKVRARMVRREDVFGDDIVEVMLDTFNDQRRAYAFVANPFGIQWDGLWTEGQGFDGSFDTVWHSRGQLTPQGYVVWMAIPFKSLRFPAQAEQTWRVILLREIPRNNEQAFWPPVSTRIEGRLNQAAPMTGLSGISPGRNLQFIPYFSFRSFRALDTRDEDFPRFQRERGEPDGGLDAKMVLKDSLVFDLTVNPDFAQVESDEPQVTVNQRFEVFFPEKRPFFLENANFFVTPIDLVFTRRIADPQFGARLTGKMGPYALGAMLIDDQSPGRRVPDQDPLRRKRALFGIVRASRDIWRQSSLGLIYAAREFQESYNRVGGFDGRFKLSPNWVAEFQGVASSTRFLDGGEAEEEGETHRAGTAFDFNIQRSSRKLFYFTEYNDRSPGFRTQTGFVPRTDIRRIEQFFLYRFRPEGKFLIAWGPNLSYERIWDYTGTRLDWKVDYSLEWEFTGESWFGFFINDARERLRPQDFEGLSENVDFGRDLQGVFFGTSYLPQVSVNGVFRWGSRINFVPPEGELPKLANLKSGELSLTLRPLTPLRIDNTYLFTRLMNRGDGTNIFNDHIIRSKWNWQFNRELSLRVILQYNSTLANREFTDLETSKNFNADFLLTYLVNPWTALYVGYNGNLQNAFLCQGPGRARPACPALGGGASELIRPRRQYINDAKQFFVKFSYLLRF